ncbi:alpha-hydroxy acid oxidase [Colwellia sp. MEBiC06753]
MGLSKRLAACHNVNDLKCSAKKKLPKAVYDYLEGGAEDELSLFNNKQAFNRYQLMTRVLTPSPSINLASQIMGMEVDLPIYISPVGQQRMYHPDADVAGATAALKHNVLFGLSTFSSKTIEQVGAANSGAKAFQLYVLSDREQNYRMIERAKKAGFESLIITVDSAVGGNRERDLRNGLTIPLKPTIATMIDFAMHPKYVFDYFCTGGKDLVNLDNAPNMKDGAEFMKFLSSLGEMNLDWQYVKDIREKWQGHLVLKGVSHIEDVKLAIDAGIDSVVLSNHGGRQLDATIAPIDQVQSVREAVGQNIEIYLDGGVTRGHDVIKALALGADGVGIGKAYGYGLAHGVPGIERCLTFFKTELERNLRLMGFGSIQELKQDGHRYIHKAG